MKYSVLAVLIVIVSLADWISSQQRPSITYISKTQYVNLGQRVELICRVAEIGNYKVIWLKVDPRSSKTELLTRGHGRTTHAHSDSHTYVIDGARQEDAGEYICRIQTEDKIDSSLHLYVNAPPAIKDDSSRSVIASIGDPEILLECSATGFPKPKIVWRRNKYELLPNGKAFHLGPQLRLHNITKEDRGTYYCQAYNGVEPSARRPIRVEV